MPLKAVLTAAILLALTVAATLLVLLSPLMIFLALLAFAIFAGIFLFRLLSRRSFTTKWGVAAASSFVLIFVFTGVSGAIYGSGEPTEIAEREPTVEEAVEETTFEPTVEETTAAMEEDSEEDSEEEEEREREQAKREEQREREAAAKRAASLESEHRAAEAAAAEEAAEQEQAERESAEREAAEAAEQESASSYDATVTITSVTDGDTVEVSPAVNGYTDVRLIGVDTPEVFFGSEPYGPESSDFATERLEGQTVELELDAEEVDDFDRLLAYVWIGDELFNETLTAEGYAQVATFPPNVKYESRFLDAQSIAQEQGLGIWGLPAAEQCQLADRGNGIGAGSANCLMPEEPVAPAPGFDEPPMQEPAPAPETIEEPVVEEPVVEESSGYLSDGWYPGAPDKDCEDFSGGVTVSPGDPYGLDGDGDGTACE